MKLFLAQALVSTIYVFDASASPLLHVPLVYLTALYLISMVEVIGLFRFVGIVWRWGRRARAAPEHGGSRSAASNSLRWTVYEACTRLESRCGRLRSTW